MADLGERPGGPEGPPPILGKKNHRRKKSQQTMLAQGLDTPPNNHCTGFLYEPLCIVGSFVSVPVYQYTMTEPYQRWMIGIMHSEVH